jgi:hypothetical protein
VPGSSDGTTLLKRHLPVLSYDSQGSFMADSPAILTNRIAPGGEANTLKRANGSVVATAAGGRRLPRLGLDFLGWPQYADGAEAAPSDFLDAVGPDYVLAAREMHRGDFADHVYGHAIRADDGGWWLQYWFFYLFNDKAFVGFGLHEGDWEMVQVRLDSDEQPREMAFAQHTHGQRCAWKALSLHDENRPVVFVARGSQASYPFPGKHSAPVIPDYADGKGPRVAGATLDVINPDDPGWAGWPGRWGSTRARNRLESDSPRGPAHQDKWGDPATFHEECDEVERRRAAPRTALRAAPEGPPQPDITARREGDRAVISYRVPQAQGQSPPVKLVVTIDSPDDSLPPATYAFPVEGAGGELEHPVPLEDKPYVVRATAADDQGNMSEQAVADLT